MLDKGFWEDRWREGKTGWDLGQASPPLTNYIDGLPLESRDWRVLIPGCGNGYEAHYLLQKGFRRVTMLDIAPTAIASLQNSLDQHYPGWRDQLELVNADFFEHEGQYELILEQTFFCALDPTLRSAYAEKMHSLLAPGGRLAGVLFDRDFEGGPPFGGSRAEYEALFARHFPFLHFEPCVRSIAPRAGSELFFVTAT